MPAPQPWRRAASISPLCPGARAGVSQVLRADRRFLVSEIAQTSEQDCGPAALASLLGGFRVPANYARFARRTKPPLSPVLTLTFFMNLSMSLRGA